MAEHKQVGLTAAARAAVTSDVRLRVLLLCENGAWSAADLAAELGRNRTTMLYHLRGLAEAGLIREAERTSVAGGTVIAYRAVHAGWATAVDALNGVAGTDSGAGAEPQ